MINNINKNDNNNNNINNINNINNNNNYSKDSSIPAHEYLLLLKEQIELVTRHLGIDETLMTKKQRQNVGTNTTFVQSIMTKELDEQQHQRQMFLRNNQGELVENARFVPLQQHSNNFSSKTTSTLSNDKHNTDGLELFDEDEKKFMAHLPDLNGEGFTSISLKHCSDPDSHSNAQTPASTLSNGMELLLKNVDDALGNRTFDATSQSFRPKLAQVDEPRRLSLPSTVVEMKRITRNLDDIPDGEKSFILLEQVEEEDDGGDDTRYLSKQTSRLIATAAANSRPPLFEQSRPTPPSLSNNTMQTSKVGKYESPLRKTLEKLKKQEYYNNSVSFCSVVDEDANGKRTATISDLSSILDDHSSIDNLNSSTVIATVPCLPASTTPSEQTTYEAFSFASLEYLKRHHLI